MAEGCISLDTAVVTLGGDMIHYRSPQNGTGKSLLADRYQWKRGALITTEVTGPAFLHKSDGKPLTALVPVRDSINAYYFKLGKWAMLSSVSNTNGTVCAAYVPVPGTTAVETIIRVGYTLKSLNAVDMKAMPYERTETPLPPAVSQIRASPCHRIRPSSPITIVSQHRNGLGHSPNTDALIFHACGTGWQDTWMILHWSILAGTNEWVVSGVVLPHVNGMPL